MIKSNSPSQFEFITNYVKNIKVELKGEKLIGDLDFMFKRELRLFPEDVELKTIYTVKTLIITADTYANTVEAEVELIINIYKYGHKMTVYDLYGMFCYATIFNYMTLTNEMIKNNIFHNEEFYKPTIIVPSFEVVEEDILDIMRGAYP